MLFDAHELIGKHAIVAHLLMVVPPNLSTFPDGLMPYADKFQLGTEKVVVEVDWVTPSENCEVRFLCILPCYRLRREASLHSLVVVAEASINALCGELRRSLLRISGPGTAT